MINLVASLVQLLPVITWVMSPHVGGLFLHRRQIYGHFLALRLRLQYHRSWIHHISVPIPFSTQSTKDKSFLIRGSHWKAVIGQNIVTLLEEDSIDMVSSNVDLTDSTTESAADDSADKRRGNEQVVSEIASEGTNKDDRRMKRHGARNQHRHKIFVKWLVDTFDLPQHSRDDSDHILDVAGGKGEVAARLTMCHCQQVVMVDPRSADIVNCFETRVLPKIPNKWQRRLEEQRSKNPRVVEETINSRFRQLVTTFDDYTMAQSNELQEVVQKASLIVGLHADGATEAIVNVALQYQKPFVVVPCCVFPNLFQDRRVLDEITDIMVPVRSHEQFCRFLLAKDPRFRLETLPFEGRNVAIWWDGKQ